MVVVLAAVVGVFACIPSLSTRWAYLCGVVPAGGCTAGRQRGKDLTALQQLPLSSETAKPWA